MKQLFAPNILAQGIVFALATAGLYGCASTSGTDSGPLYQGSRTVDTLEMPPDLIAPRMGQAFQIPESPQERISARELGATAAPSTTRLGPGTGVATGTTATQVLPESPDVQLLRDGQVRWLLVAVSPEVLWPQLREFWRTQNLALSRDEPLVGVMETEWAENRAGIPLRFTQGLFSRALGGVFDAGTRDQFRMRVERVPTGTEIFVSHRGAVETGSGDGQAFRWVMGESDPNLEAEMLNRLLAFLAVGETTMTTQTAPEETDFERSGRVDLVEREGQVVLTAWGEQEAMWRRLGLALDRTGLLVDEQNRREGQFLVTYRPDLVEATESPGFLGRIFGGTRTDRRQNERFQVRLTAEGRELAITALSVTGEPLNQRDARFVLELIQPELR